MRRPAAGHEHVAGQIDQRQVRLVRQVAGAGRPGGRFWSKRRRRSSAGGSPAVPRPPSAKHGQGVAGPARVFRKSRRRMRASPSSRGAGSGSAPGSLSPSPAGHNGNRVLTSLRGQFPPAPRALALPTQALPLPTRALPWARFSQPFRLPRRGWRRGSGSRAFALG